jgi:galactofuranose transport system permease protein
MSTLTKHRLFWPVVVLVVLLIGNLFEKPDFFAIRIQDGHLYGSVIDILRFGAPLMLVALGMTLVIATGGIDLSVGSVVSIAGAVACLHISRQPDQNAVGVVLVAVAMALGAALVAGAFNGVMVSRIGIQPIIATLILMVVGRGIAQLIMDGQIITINSSPYKWIGAGWLFTLPAAVLIALAMTGIAALIMRRSALGLLLESVGGNAEASRLVGIRSRSLVLLVYVVSGLCAGLAGLMISSNVSAADGNNAGLLIELDAILAVVIGGTALTGGRFSLGGTVIGALVIQTLSTTVYTLGVPPETTLIFKAVVVTIVCLLQSPAFRRKVFGRWGPRRTPPASGTPAEPTNVKVPA